MTNPTEDLPTPKPAQMFPDDPFGRIKSDRKDDVPDASTVKVFHRKADTDTGRNALHHTLGHNRNQASPGSHTHDGSDSRLIGHEMGLTIVGATAADALRSLITQLQQVMDITDSSTF